MRRSERALSVRGLILPAIRDFNRYRGSFIFFGVWLVVVVVIGAVLLLQACARGALNLFTFGLKAATVMRAYIHVGGDDTLSISPGAPSREPHLRRTGWAVGVIVIVYLAGAI